jgi:hypothetical protein
MAGPRMTRCPDAGPASDEEKAEQAVLALLLEVHPAHLSLDEVVRELTDRPDDFAPRDRVNNAVRDLVAAGLLHRHGAFLFATRAAVRFEDLRI